LVLIIEEIKKFINMVSEFLIKYIFLGRDE